MDTTALCMLVAKNGFVIKMSLEELLVIFLSLE